MTEMIGGPLGPELDRSRTLRRRFYLCDTPIAAALWFADRADKLILTRETS